MNITKLKQHPKTFTRLFGISPDKFDALVIKINPLWIRAELKRLRHPRKIKKGGGRRYKLTLEETIAMLLLYTRAYATHVFLSALFDIHESAVCRYFAKIRPIAETVFDLPTKNSDLSEEEILKLVVDATEQRTERRRNGCGYSGKKKAHTARHSRKRIVIEHVFASLKAFRILADRFRGSLAHYHQYFLIVCGLRNLARS